MGGDLRAMVSDSRTISADQNRCDCNILGGSQSSPMVFGGRHLFWSWVLGNRSYPRCDWAFMKLERDTSMSEFMVNNNVDPFIPLYRKAVDSFRNRMLNSKNEIVSVIFSCLFFETSKISERWSKALFLFTVNTV